MVLRVGVCVCTCEVDVCETLSQRGYRGCESVDGLVCDLSTLTQVQFGQVRQVSNQQPRRCIRHLQTSQSQLSNILEPPTPTLSYKHTHT